MANLRLAPRRVMGEVLKFNRRHFLVQVDIRAVAYNYLQLMMIFSMKCISFYD